MVSWCFLTVFAKGNFAVLTEFSFVERLILEDNEYIVSCELGINELCVTALRFTTNYRVCKWLGPDPHKQVQFGSRCEFCVGVRIDCLCFQSPPCMRFIRAQLVPLSLFLCPIFFPDPPFSLCEYV